MNKLLLTLTTLLFSLSVMAQFDVINSTNREIRKAGNAPSGTCLNCRTDTGHEVDSIKLITTRQRNGLPHFNPTCKNFIKDDGTYGPWGETIKDYIVAKGGANSRFFSAALPGMQSAPKTCPKWGEISEQEKMKFWVWMMASISQVESSCDTNSVNTGSVPDPTDRPRGLFQLNTLRNNRKWRGPNCGFPNGAAAVYIADNSIKCSLDIMDEVLKGRSGEYKSNGKIFPANTYWEKLRSNHSSTGGPIGRLVRQYPPCGATP